MQYRLFLVHSRNRGATLFFLIVLLFNKIVFAEESQKDPFRPFPAFFCNTKHMGMNDWQLVGVLISEEFTTAFLTHIQQGTKEIVLGGTFNNAYWKVSAITLEKVELESVLPCPPLSVEITFLRR